jgi:imidazolonepropionase-like amidohydrolase
MNIRVGVLCLLVLACAQPQFRTVAIRDLERLVEAGLTPLAALQSATLNPARVLKMLDSLGTVDTGKLADLIVLDANPLADIRNTQKIRAVVANGRLYRRSDLDQLLVASRR